MFSKPHFPDAPFAPHDRLSEHEWLKVQASRARCNPHGSVRVCLQFARLDRKVAMRLLKTRCIFGCCIGELLLENRCSRLYMSLAGKHRK